MSKNTNNAFLGHPKPLLSLSLTELWERFSYYGIRPLMVLFMAAAIHSGGLEMQVENAAAIVGIWMGAMYLLTLPGGWLADNLFGQRRAILIGSIIIALGHLSIAFGYFHSIAFFFGLCLIAIGSGLFKTCASVMVGMLYKDGDARRDSGFTIFYMCINLGALFAPLITGFVAQEFGWHLGFGIGGIGMLIALAIFSLKTLRDFREFEAANDLDGFWDKPKQIHRFAKPFIALFLGVFALLFVLVSTGVITIDPVSLSKHTITIILTIIAVYFAYLFIFVKLTSDERKNLVLVLILFFSSAFFWSAFEQQPTSFNLFARDFTDRVIFGYEVSASWSQFLNPLFIVIFAPIASVIWIYLARRNIEISSISKFAIGIILAGVGFGVMIFAANAALASGGKVSALWLVGSLWFLTIGEICLSPVGLSIMTKIAPKVLQGSVMGIWFASSALGGVISGLIGGNVRADNIESLPSLFTHCASVLFVVAALLFALKIIMAKKFKM